MIYLIHARLNPDPSSCLDPTFYGVFVNTVVEQLWSRY